MKKTAFLATSVILTLTSSIAFAGEWLIDASHSNVDFTIRHLVSKVTGSFKDFEGKFSFDAAKPESAQGSFTIKLASINTANEKRDGHLKSADFFDVEKFPAATFAIKKTTKTAKDHFKMSGELNLHGVTKPVTLDVEYLGSDKDPWGNTKAGFVASTQIKRKDFGITWNKTLDSGNVMLGDDVDLRIQIEANAAK